MQKQKLTLFLITFIVIEDLFIVIFNGIHEQSGGKSIFVCNRTGRSLFI